MLADCMLPVDGLDELYCTLFEPVVLNENYGHNNCLVVLCFVWYSFSLNISLRVYHVLAQHKTVVTVETLYSTIYYSKYFIELNIYKFIICCPLNSQKTPHTSPFRASYGVSFMSTSTEIDRVIKGFYCTPLLLHWIYPSLVLPMHDEVMEWKHFQYH